MAGLYLYYTVHNCSTKQVRRRIDMSTYRKPAPLLDRHFDTVTDDARDLRRRALATGFIS